MTQGAALDRGSHDPNAALALVPAPAARTCGWCAERPWSGCASASSSSRWWCRCSPPGCSSCRASTPRRTSPGRVPRVWSRSACPPTGGDHRPQRGPLAESVDGLMVVADPSLTVKHASEIAVIIARRLAGGLLRRARTAPQARHPLPVHRPSGPVDRGPAVVRRDHRPRLQGHRHPPRPAPVLPRGRRGRQPGRFHERRGRRRRGRRADVRHPAVGQGRLGDVRGRRRQPIPLGENSVVALRSEVTTLPSPSTGTSSGTPSAWSAPPCRTPEEARGRGGDGLPQR